MKAETDTLVCIFLRGGADTLNMVIPYGDDEYYKMRPTIGIPKPNTQVNEKASLRLNDLYAFHPQMKALLQPFSEGRLAIVQAVGSDNTSGSHFEAMDQMERGESTTRTVGGGWLGRYLSTLTEPMSALSAVAIGPTVPESLRGAPSVSAVQSLEEMQLKAPAQTYNDVRAALKELYASESDMVAKAGLDTLDLMSRVQQLQQNKYKPAGGVSYPDTQFSRGLQEVARLIKASVGLRVACVDLGGWDTHFVQGQHEGLQANLIQQFSEGLSAFDRDVKAIREHVHVLVLTEFGRRIYENSSLGTDHGRGFAAFVLSNKVNGGRILGQYPGLSEESAEFLGPSGLRVVHEFRSLLAEVLIAIAVNPAVDKIFPGLNPETIGLFQ